MLKRDLDGILLGVELGTMYGNMLVYKDGQTLETSLDDKVIASTALEQYSSELFGLLVVDNFIVLYIYQLMV